MAREACADPADPAGPAGREPDRAAADPGQPQIDSRALFGASRVVTIRHGEDCYTLRITRAEKLILTK